MAWATRIAAFWFAIHAACEAARALPTAVLLHPCRGRVRHTLFGWSDMLVCRFTQHTQLACTALSGIKVTVTVSLFEQCKKKGSVDTALHCLQAVENTAS
jgi:hypothetical protein